MFDLRSIALGFVMMVKKFTCANIKVDMPYDENDLQSGVVTLPVIGLIIGFFACFLSSFRIFYDSYLVSVVVFAYYCIITGAKNLTDTYRTLNYIIKPKNKDEQIVGIIGIVIICMFYFSLLRLLPHTAVLMMPVTGFSGLVILSTVFDRDKTGTSIIKYCGRYEQISAFVIAFVIAVLVDYRLVIPVAVTYMISAFIVNVIDLRIEVIPSSAEGFLIEIIQIVFLIVTYVFKII